MAGDEIGHRWTKFGAFTGVVFREKDAWGARIGLRLWCVIQPRRLNAADRFPTEAAAKNWVRQCAETLGILR